VAEGVVRGAFKASLEALCTSSTMSDIVTEAGIKVRRNQYSVLMLLAAACDGTRPYQRGIASRTPQTPALPPIAASLETGTAD